LETLIRHGSFQADAILFDGYKLTTANLEDVRKIKAFAQALNVEVWFSVSPVRADVKVDQFGVPETMGPYLDVIDLLVGLRFNDANDKVLMTLVKGPQGIMKKPLGVNLDPKTMLITK
jgi:hypothetical protein